MAGSDLLELDSLEINVIVDNELDPISPSPSSLLTQSGGMATVALGGPTLSDRGGAKKELRMDHICCSAHGLSLLITGTKDGRSHTVLFDTGPEESAWERNAKRLRADVGKVEVVQLSHWHRDHSGGMLKALQIISAAREGTEHASLPPVQVDLHPARPLYRGNQPPEFPVVSMEADPTFAEIEESGGKVVKSDQSHTVCEDYFLVSGEIPRETAYERGLRFGVRCDDLNEGWKKDEVMADERFLMCKLKGRPPFLPDFLRVNSSLMSNRQGRRNVHGLLPRRGRQRFASRRHTWGKRPIVRHHGRLPPRGCRRRDDQQLRVGLASAGAEAFARRTLHWLASEV